MRLPFRCRSFPAKIGHFSGKRSDRSPVRVLVAAFCTPEMPAAIQISSPATAAAVLRSRKALVHEAPAFVPGASGLT